jgi:hypothetical protein
MVDHAKKTRCWKDQKPYDEQVYRQALQRHGSPLLKRIQALSPAPAGGSM